MTPIIILTTTNGWGKNNETQMTTTLLMAVCDVKMSLKIHFFRSNVNNAFLWNLTQINPDNLGYPYHKFILILSTYL